MAGSLVKLSGNSRIIGSVLMTDGDDVVEIGALTSGKLLENITDGMFAVFDGRDGTTPWTISAYALADVLSLGLNGNRAVLNLPRRLAARAGHLPELRVLERRRHALHDGRPRRPAARAAAGGPAASRRGSGRLLGPPPAPHGLTWTGPGRSAPSALRPARRARERRENPGRQGDQEKPEREAQDPVEHRLHDPGDRALGPTHRVGHGLGRVVDDLLGRVPAKFGRPWTTMEPPTQSIAAVPTVGEPA
jgi:hypothetical protein